MRKSFKQPVQSDFGYTSPFFNVDSLGNITATSLTLSEESLGIQFDYEFLETVDGIISIVGQTGNFPTITISKTETVYFGLTLTNTGLYILEDDGETLFSGNMVHDTGLRGRDAQGKKTGYYTINIPTSSNITQLFYSNEARTQFGTIVVTEAIGIFDTVTIKNIEESTDLNTGALIVNGGVAVDKNISIGNNLQFFSSSSPAITSISSLDINPTTNITIKIDNVTIGQIDSIGSTLPIYNTFGSNLILTNVLLDSSPIGQTTPSTGNFTNGTVNEITTSPAAITNRNYVDSAALGFSIIFGI